MRFEHFNPPFENHEKLAQCLTSGYKLSTAIVIADQIDHNLAKDPKFATIQNHIMCSIVEEDARREMTNSYRGVDEVEKLLLDWGVNFKASNNSTEDQNRKFKSDILDLVFKAETIALYPEIIENIRRNCRKNQKKRKKKSHQNFEFQ